MRSHLAAENTFSSEKISRKRRFSELESSTPELNKPSIGTAGVSRSAKLDDAVPANAPPDPPTSFDIDEFYRLFTRWYVKRNKPFTDIDRETFRDVLLYLEPSLDGKLDRLPAFQDTAEGRLQSRKQ